MRRVWSNPGLNIWQQRHDAAMKRHDRREKSVAAGETYQVLKTQFPNAQVRVSANSRDPSVGQVFIDGGWLCYRVLDGQRAEPVGAPRKPALNPIGTEAKKALEDAGVYSYQASFAQAPTRVETQTFYLLPTPWEPKTAKPKAVHLTFKRYPGGGIEVSGLPASARTTRFHPDIINNDWSYRDSRFESKNTSAGAFPWVLSSTSIGGERHGEA